MDKEQFNNLKGADKIRKLNDLFQEKKKIEEPLENPMKEFFDGIKQ